MISQFNIEYPLWWLMLPIAIGGLYAILLYVKNKNNKISANWTILLFILRFCSTAIISLLLLTPFIKTTKKIIQKPRLIIAVDNSQSMISSSDSVYLTSGFEADLNSFENTFSEDYEIDKLLFGLSVKPFDSISFDEEGSDYSKLFAYVDEHYVKNEVDAMIMVGDGIFNLGTDPFYASSKIKFPIFSLAVGDTVVKPDLRINDIAYNSLVYLNENIPLEINFSANGLRNQNVLMNVYSGDKLQKSRKISISNNNFTKTESFDLSTQSPGKLRIRIELTVDIDESNKANNYKNIFIDVLDARQKILILANSPHPDISALRQAISGFKNYEVDIAFADKLDFVISDYSLIILHQLPSVSYPISKTLNIINETGIPILIILGEQSNQRSTINFFGSLGFNSAVRSFENSLALFNQNFPLFSLDEIDVSLLETLPPLKVPLGNFKNVNPANVLAWQKIHTIKTNFPLIYFTEEDRMKKCLIMGEGLWLWRNYNYLEKSNFTSFDDLLGKTVQYLMAKTDKRFFRIKSKGEYNTYDNIKLEAELYNKSYEPIEDAEVDLKLTNEKGEAFDFVFSPVSGSYILELDTRDPGIYKYIASATYKEETYSEKGEFIIFQNNFEAQQLIANYDLLYNISERNNGKFMFVRQLDSVEDLLREKEIKNIISYSQTYSGLNNIPLILFLIIMLLTIEWVLRKYLGNY